MAPGPKLAGTVVADFPNIGDQITIIENGKGGGAMPAWKGTLSRAEIQAVAEYTRQCLGQGQLLTGVWLADAAEICALSRVTPAR